MAFHVCAGDGFLGEETLRFSSGVFYGCSSLIRSGSVCAGHVSCFHVFEPVIPALEPSAWSLCVLVDVLFRRVVTRRAMRGDVAVYHLVFAGSLPLAVLGRVNHKEQIIGDAKITGF
ncbi:hypothetical protein DY000_02039442 [Brassica cretica]|uniref:Uncharacterized protein n=1 Tax=Brassica cretica TaxID=69181 RepID=A0ABQ7BE27_BRACR|nr:hypothetical protein DY000_02039442 [Brassica cretica]